jgi:hypothetical protein
VAATLAAVRSGEDELLEDWRRDAGAAQWRSRSPATATRSAPCGPGHPLRVAVASSGGTKPVVLDGANADWAFVVAHDG